MFGIYPGQGPSAAFGPIAGQVPEDPAKRLAALETLRGTAARPFVMHLYAGYMGPGSASAWRIAGHQAMAYEAAGFDVELVLRYRAQNDVPGYLQYVRDAVRAFGSNPRFVSVQVTNEADGTDCAACSDGPYPGAEDALIAGVVAAKEEARSDGFDQIKVGFNVSTMHASFWNYLADHGTPAFRADLDWVGLDCYPSTSSPLAALISQQIGGTLTAALTTLRATLMPLAGLGSRVALHLSEQGYPTALPGVTDAMQSVALVAAVDVINLLQKTDNITEYNWFDLRDAYPTGSTEPTYGQYGLMTADYVPKPAFEAYKHLIATIG